MAVEYRLNNVTACRILCIISFSLDISLFIFDFLFLVNCHKISSNRFHYSLSLVSTLGMYLHYRFHFQVLRVLCPNLTDDSFLDYFLNHILCPVWLLPSRSYCYFPSILFFSFLNSTTFLFF